MSQLHVRDVMTHAPVCCICETPIVDAAQMMIECDCGALPVVAELVGRKPVGIVTDRDILARTLAKGRDPMKMTVRDCLSAPAITIAEDEKLHACIGLLERHRIRRVVVVDQGGSCIGIVALADIARHAQPRETAELVREVSQPSPPAHRL